MPPNAKWVGLAAHIRKQIETGELPPGAKLPSTSQLCAEHDVSAIVVRNAMIALKAEGLVVGVPGVGVFVVDPDESTT
ncbi:winged helix-turn-helix domain-containing protein [Solwaraspora sp. WMMD937]|uniref:winged helix-turn-helix domain-containing protein n=1 Tax=Solwaraspora sp. WMMD937 TaxID=3016090 RepID=UPI00249B5B1A|nr:winged helix-turn-helix domain-containing protein [Solwaraspora sp. WMMD937]WFE20939.1 winged helix-turn-helix domain-containing protein [Solwaraspora sp. WMMD937]